MTTARNRGIRVPQPPRHVVGHGGAAGDLDLSPRPSTSSGRVSVRRRSRSAEVFSSRDELVGSRRRRRRPRRRWNVGGEVLWTPSTRAVSRRDLGEAAWKGPVLASSTTSIGEPVPGRRPGHQVVGDAGRRALRSFPASGNARRIENVGTLRATRTRTAPTAHAAGFVRPSAPSGWSGRRRPAAGAGTGCAGC